MRRGLKIVVIVLVVLVVLVVGAVFFAASVFESDEFKEKFSAKVYEETGRVVVIDGDIKVSVFPWIGLKMGKLYLADLDGFSKDPIVEVGSSKFKLEFLPLLSGNVKIDEIALEKVNLKLEIDAKGRKNWELLTKGKGAKADASSEAPSGERTSGSSGGAFKVRFAMNRFSVSDSRVRYIDRPGKAGYVVDLKEVRIDDIAPGKTAKLAATLAARDGQGRSGDLALKGAVSLGEDGGLGPIDLSPVKIGAVFDKKFSKINASMDVGFSLAEMKANVKNILIKSDEVDCAGEVTVLLPGAGGLGKGLVADVRGKLDVNRITLPEKDPKSADAQAGGGQKDEEGPAAKKAPDFSALAGLYAELSVHIKEFNVSKFTLKDIRLPIKADKGLVTVAPYSFKLFTGEFDGTVTANLREKTPAISGTNTVKNLEVSDFLPKGKTLVKGKLQSTMAVTGKGLDWESLAPTLSGDGNFEVVNGEVKNFVIIPGGIIPGLDSKKLPTDFSLDKVTGSVKITNGIASNQDFVMLSPLVSATGRGSANLPASSLDYQLDIDVPGVPLVPASIRGPFSNLSYSVDMKKLLEGLGKTELGQKLGDKLNEQLKKHLPGSTNGTSTSGPGGAGSGEGKTRQKLDKLGEGLKSILK